MPRILGLNLVGVLIATIAFYMVGWLWYGVLFMDEYMASMGISEADAEGMSPAMLGIGLVITILQVVGLGLVLKWKNAAGIAGAVTTALVLWLVFALPFSAYGYIYGTTSASLFMIDATHLLVGWVISAAVLALIK